ncbi:prepilin peptidase [Hippea maritima]|uniref:Prepilin leader peptidase/N-methyltransferase n=1 Tax=Hippea maritima (strain ATCC 700847 / DSM 10411 / MH2) TaxID=760142 RepID=F2LUZ6_HIPMA|nr:A24 family peptidase [Hippea maritima]AEA33580.1 Prepilin peptidase [Hippea maritima DSM 10411]
MYFQQKIILDLIAFIFGLIIGSFLNVCIYRIPLGKSIVWPASFCPNCKQKIRWHDNIPVVSFILLKGRCRYCKSKISPIYPVVELLTGLLTLFVFMRFGLSLDGVFYLVFVYSLIVASFVDLKHYIIPDRISLGLIAVGLVFGYIRGDFLGSLYGFLAGFFGLYIMAIIGSWVFKKEAMGGGDIKLLGGIGAFLGIKGVLFSLFSASLFGSFVGIALILFGKKSYADKLQFGPYLSVGAVLYIFIGKQLIFYLYGW